MVVKWFFQNEVLILIKKNDGAVWFLLLMPKILVTIHFLFPLTWKIHGFRDKYWYSTVGKDVWGDQNFEGTKNFPHHLQIDPYNFPPLHSDSINFIASGHLLCGENKRMYTVPKLSSFEFLQNELLRLTVETVVFKAKASDLQLIDILEF